MAFFACACILAAPWWIAQPAAETALSAATASSTENREDPSASIRILLDGLEAKRQQLAAEEKRLQEQRLRLESLKQEIEQQIDELARVRQGIQNDLAMLEQKKTEAERQNREAEADKIKQLVKIYTSMKPKTAATLIEKLDMDVVLKLFSQMKGEQIGQILSYVESEKAAHISEQLAARKNTAAR